MYGRVNDRLWLVPALSGTPVDDSTVDMSI